MQSSIYIYSDRTEIIRLTQLICNILLQSCAHTNERHDKSFVPAVYKYNFMK